MSYEFGMYFKQLNKDEDICSILELLSKRLYENKEDYIRKNIYYIPSLRNLKLDSSKDEVDEYWLYSLFDISCIYWKDYNLLAINGYDYPYFKDIFTTHICFQNSCDQDYDYKEWGNKINIFNQTIDSIKKANNEELFAIMERKYENYSKEEMLENLEYTKRSAVYEKIYNLLDLNNWLYDNPSDKFNRLSINAINSFEKWMYCKPVLKNIKQEILEDLNN